jgi:serine protease Do
LLKYIPEAPMKGLAQAALTTALVMAVGFIPGPAAQGRTSVVRALDVARGSRLGVSVSDIEEADAKDVTTKAGVVVETVEPGGPAEKAGVKTGDTITEFDGEKVRGVRQFTRLVQETPAGRSVAVALLRGSQHLTVNVTASRASLNDDFALRLLETPLRPAMPMPPEPPRAPRAPEAVTPPVPLDMFRVASGRSLGVSLETLDEQLAQYFGVKDGVLVRSVEEGSAAAKAGLKAGDVITSVNTRRVYEAQDVNRALARTDGSGAFALEIVRDRKPQTLKGTLETRARGRGSVMVF